MFVNDNTGILFVSKNLLQAQNAQTSHLFLASILINPGGPFMETTVQIVLRKHGRIFYMHNG